MTFMVRLTAMDPEVLLQMVLVLEGLAALGTLELAVSCLLVEHLVLEEANGKTKKIKNQYTHGK